MGVAHDKTECRLEFMSQKNFYRYIVIGVLALLTTLGVSVVWALSVSSDQAVLKDSISNHSLRIDKIEKQSEDRHNQVLSILRTIDSKVSR